MNKMSAQRLFRALFFASVSFLVLHSAWAQQPSPSPQPTQPATQQPQAKPVTPPTQQQIILAPAPPVVEDEQPITPPPPPAYVNPTNFRILGHYDYAISNPKDLNDHRSTLLWNNTTPSQGKLNNLAGFSVGAGYRLGPGFLGVEYNRASQELANTPILPTALSVRDTFEYEAAYLLYDFVIQPGPAHSFEFGGGVGYAVKYQFHNLLTNNGSQEDVYWQSNPMVYKARAAYNYHLTENFVFRIGAAYEYAVANTLTADSNHPTVLLNGSTIISGQTLRNSSGQAVKADISGVRLHVGGALSF